MAGPIVKELPRVGRMVVGDGLDRQSGQPRDVLSIRSKAHPPGRVHNLLQASSIGHVALPHRARQLLRQPPSMRVHPSRRSARRPREVTQ
eukprot:9484888-Pyramimonas_sp.AAC.1